MVLNTSEVPDMNCDGNFIIVLWCNYIIMLNQFKIWNGPMIFNYFQFVFNIRAKLRRQNVRNTTYLRQDTVLPTPLVTEQVILQYKQQLFAYAFDIHWGTKLYFLHWTIKLGIILDTYSHDFLPQWLNFVCVYQRDDERDVLWGTGIL